MKPTPSSIAAIQLEIQKLVDLPAISPIIAPLMAAISNDDVSIQELAAIIQLDSSLTARIIGLSNSAYFGQREPITRVEDAIFKALGIRMTKNLALSIALIGSFSHKIKCDGFKLHNFWLTALFTASLARGLSHYTSRQQPVSEDEAYLAGLLHDLGILPILYLYGEQVCSIVTQARNDDELRDGLKKTLGVNHHQVGYWLASKWRIPANIALAIGHYPDADYSGTSEALVRLTHASRQCVEQYLHSGNWPKEVTPALDILAQLGISAADIRNSEDEMQKNYPALESIVNLLSGD